MEKHFFSANPDIWKDGVQVFKDVIARSLLDKCRQFFSHGLGELQSRAQCGERFYVSKGRYYSAICIEGPLASPEILLFPALEGLLMETLGVDFVFDSFGIINASPGADEQQWHRDGGVLFPGHPLEFMLPASAVTLAIPLVEMNDETGTTGFSLGSHRNEGHAEAPDFCPLVDVGSAIVWDYRIFHKGLANQSPRDRPLIYATYSRPWWSDHGNFDEGRAEKLAITKRALNSLDANLQVRLARAIVR